MVVRMTARKNRLLLLKNRIRYIGFELRRKGYLREYSELMRIERKNFSYYRKIKKVKTLLENIQANKIDDITYFEELKIQLTYEYVDFMFSISKYWDVENPPNYYSKQYEKIYFLPVLTFEAIKQNNNIVLEAIKDILQYGYIRPKTEKLLSTATDNLSKYVLDVYREQFNKKYIEEITEIFNIIKEAYAIVENDKKLLKQNPIDVIKNYYSPGDEIILNGIRKYIIKNLLNDYIPIIIFEPWMTEGYRYAYIIIEWTNNIVSKRKPTKYTTLKCFDLNTQLNEFLTIVDTIKKKMMDGEDLTDIIKDLGFEVKGEAYNVIIRLKKE